MANKDEFDKLYNKVLKLLRKEGANPKLVYEVCMTALLVTAEYLDIPADEVSQHVLMAGTAAEVLEAGGDNVTFIQDTNKTIH